MYFLEGIVVKILILSVPCNDPKGKAVYPKFPVYSKNIPIMAPMYYTPCLHALDDCKQHSIECGMCGM